LIPVIFSAIPEPINVPASPAPIILTPSLLPAVMLKCNVLSLSCLQCHTGLYPFLNLVLCQYRQNTLFAAHQLYSANDSKFDGRRTTSHNRQQSPPFGNQSPAMKTRNQESGSKLYR
jgi:hypothetical protein